jgi:hypothetical protein
MPSTTIYGAFPTTTIGPFHYLYRITNLVEQKHYYGIRTSKNILPHQDLGIKYFSSSLDKNFKIDQKEHSENYKYKVIIVSNSRKRILELEVKLHNKFNVSKNEHFYNRMLQTSAGFDSSGKVVMRDGYGNIYHVFDNDPRIENGELVGIAKGKVCMIDGEGKTYQVFVDDQRISTGELQSINKGKATMQDSNGNYIRVDIDDPRIKTGELISIFTGMATMRDQYGKCVRVSNNDPRIKNGELVGVTTGMAQMRDSDGKIYHVSTSDPRIASGELFSISKGFFPAKNKMGVTKIMSKDSLEWKSGEFVNITRKFIFVTPFGKIINDFTKIPYKKLYRMCITYNDYLIKKSIFEKYKPYLGGFLSFNEVEGKTFKDLGFGVENWDT